MKHLIDFMLYIRFNRKPKMSCRAPGSSGSSRFNNSKYIPMSKMNVLSYIQGLAYFLEDGKSAISPNEALMWAKVNPFSPLASGLRINPF